MSPLFHVRASRRTGTARTATAPAWRSASRQALPPDDPPELVPSQHSPDVLPSPRLGPLHLGESPRAEILEVGARSRAAQLGV